MNLMEKMVRAYQNNEPMPLKGHTKITLTDVKTGKTKVIEKDNMITNAVADILTKNWCGLARFTEIFPLMNMFSGVLCFEGEITENADNYNPPNDVENECICHAGPDAHSTAEVNRGQPNVAEWDVQDTSIKFVWDFSTSVQGEIRTVCLCPATLGNMGLKPFTDTYNPLSGFGDNRHSNGSWTEEYGKRYPISIAADGKTAKAVYADGTRFTEYTMRHDYLAFGIMRTTEDWQEVSSRDATLSTAFDNNKSFIFQDADNYYVGTPTSATNIKLQTISKTDMSVTEADLGYTGVSLSTSNLGGGKNKQLPVWAFDGKYLYFPNSSNNQFYKLNISNLSDVTLCPETITIHLGQHNQNLSGGEQFITPIAISEGLVLGDNYIVNGAHAYQIAQTKQVLGNSGYSQNNRWLDAIKSGAACYGHAYTGYSSGTAGQGAILNQMALTTINVLDDVVNKTTSTTMKIEYTLLEV